MASSIPASAPAEVVLVPAPARVKTRRRRSARLVWLGAGFVAALLVIALFTVYFTIRMILRPMETGRPS